MVLSPGWKGRDLARRGTSGGGQSVHILLEGWGWLGGGLCVMLREGEREAWFNGLIVVWEGVDF